MSLEEQTEIRANAPGILHLGNNKLWEKKEGGPDLQGTSGVRATGFLAMVRADRKNAEEGIASS